MTAILFIIAAALLLAVVAKTKDTMVSVSRSFGDTDIRELIREYLSLKLKSVNVLKPKKGGDKGETTGQDCKKMKICATIVLPTSRLRFGRRIT